MTVAIAPQNGGQKVARPIDTVRMALERMKPQFQMALPKHLTPERLLRVAVTAIQNTPKLLDCDRTSLFAAIMTCAQLGLEPDGVLGQAYLVPYRGRDGMRVQFIPGYKGLITLARNSGDVSSIAAREVCENDKFDFAFGLNDRLEHVPARGDRGRVTHFYAVARFKDGGQHWDVMTVEEVEAIRDKSEGFRAFKAGRIKDTPWAGHFVEMGKKTMIRRIAKYLPMSVQKATAIDQAADRGKPAAVDKDGDVTIDATATEAAEPAGQIADQRSSRLDQFETEPAPADDQAAETVDPQTGEILDADAVDAEPPAEPTEEQWAAMADQLIGLIDATKTEPELKALMMTPKVRGLGWETDMALHAPQQHDAVSDFLNDKRAKLAPKAKRA